LIWRRDENKLKIQKVTEKIANLKILKEDDDLIFYTSILQFSIDSALTHENGEQRHQNTLNYVLIDTAI